MSDKKGKKTIEETYQRKTPLEHVLLRPDTYIGSVENITEEQWVYDEGKGMDYRTITYVPGLYKIFDEILVNAADNYQRDRTMTEIRVDIDKEAGEISVWNNGEGIPVEIHSEEKMYVPELIFGHLLTSSNYDDDIKKVTGGRNGYGAKLANIFSTRFVVEAMDHKRGKKFHMEWNDNMMTRHEPEISKVKGKEDWTKVTFCPDFAKFGMTELDDDTLALMYKRVYDIAGCNSVLKVKLNGKVIPMKNFESYVELYFKGRDQPHVFKKFSDRWEVCVSLSESGEFQQVSFVNSICTTRGGTHVKYITEALSKKLVAIINKKNKAAPVKPTQVRNHMFVFVNALIENPAFDSQTKGTLTTQAKNFGSKCEIDEAFLKLVTKKIGIVQTVLSWAKFRQDSALNRKGGGKKARVTGIAKLDDANEAGGKNGQYCTLILTEGDSAKTMAVTGLGVVGRDRYGVFPLKGKPLNVREANHNQILSNAEFTNIKQILGLKHGVKYEDVKNLRYGRLMIMTDQDHDGSHIKGLVINFIHHFWPSLLKVDGFMNEFITPIVKATHKNGEKLSFYTTVEYENWKKTAGEGWKIKYYKGLGTNSRDEAIEYFSDLNRHKIKFRWTGEKDGDLIDMAFSKKRAEDRKTWITNFEPGTFLDQDVEELAYSDFINKELIHFSIADCARSIPCVVDGLKPAQRKILYCCIKKNVKNEMKVSQLSGMVSLESAYHHGEESLNKAIIGMAQCFVGANNINFLFPGGSFGSRLQGGKDAASPRYIFTRLSNITRTIFHPSDDALLNYLDDDGLSVEPAYYMPVLPTVLINGSDGIGTGWSSEVPNYNPREIVDNLKRLLNKEEPEEMHPWYRGFQGTIERDTGGKIPRYKVTGLYRKLDSHTLEITELPIGTWTEKYKELLEELMNPPPKAKKKEPLVKDYEEHHTDTKVHFIVTLTDEAAKLPETTAGLEKAFKLFTYLSLNNMHLFSQNGTIYRYETVSDILKEFYNLRLEFYDKRKKYMTDLLQKQLSKLDNQVRFILAVIEGKLHVNNRKKADLYVQLEKDGYDKFEDEKKQNKKKKKEKDDKKKKGQEKKGKESTTGYNYLLSMPIWSLTKEKVDKLVAQRDQKKEELTILTSTPIKELWLKDLDEFLKALDEFDAEIALSEENGSKARKGKGRARAPPRRKPAMKKAKKEEDDDSEDEFQPTKATTKKTSPVKKAPVARAPAVKKEKEAEKAPAARGRKRKTDEVAPGQTFIDSLFKKPEGKKEAPAKKLKTEKDSDNEDDGDSSFELESKKPATKAAAAKTTTAAKAKPAPAAKRGVKRTKRDSDDDDDGDFALDIDDKPPAKKRVLRKAPVKKIAISDEDDDDDNESEDEKEKGKKAGKEKDEESEEESKPATKGKGATKAAAPEKKAAPAKKKGSLDDLDYDSGDEVASLTERIAKKLEDKKGGTKEKEATAAKKQTRTSDLLLDLSDSDESDKENEPVKPTGRATAKKAAPEKKAAPAKRAPAKKAAPEKKATATTKPPLKRAASKKDVELLDISSDNDEEEEKAVTKKKTTTATATKAKAAPAAAKRQPRQATLKSMLVKKKKADSDDDDFIDDDEDGGSSFAAGSDGDDDGSDYSD